MKKGENQDKKDRDMKSRNEIPFTKGNAAFNSIFTLTLVALIFLLLKGREVIAFE